MKHQVEKAAKMLANMKIERSRDKKQIPIPSKEDLERKFTMDFKSDGNPTIREVK